MTAITNSNGLSSLLMQLERELVRQRARVVPYLAPGASDEEAREPWSKLGIELPDEAVAWWGWHNGLDPLPDEFHSVRIGPWPFFSSEQAAAEYVRLREYAEDMVDDLPDRGGVDGLWAPSWVPLSTSEQMDCIYLDAAVAAGRVGAVGVRQWHEPGTGPELKSLRDVVAIWLLALDTGAWRVDPQRRVWLSNWDMIDLELSHKVLI